MVGGADSSRDRFSAANFYVALASSIDEQIDIQIESFKKELLTVSFIADSEMSHLITEVSKAEISNAGGEESRQ